MKPIALMIDDPVFRYEQVARQGMTAIYTQTHKASSVTRFEVIWIQERLEHTWPNGVITPAHEAYPGAKRWGTLGFTFFSLAAAQAKLAQLTQEQKGCATCSQP